MAFGIGDILQTLQQITLAMQTINTTIKSAFPQVSATSTSVTAGTITFTSSEAALFLTVITSSGGTYKTPLYLP